MVFKKSFLLILITLFFFLSNAVLAQGRFKVEGLSNTFSNLGEAEVALRSISFFHKPLENDGQEYIKTSTSERVIYTYSAPIVEPIKKKWSYSAIRCAEAVKDFSNEIEAAKAGAKYNYSPLCVPPIVSPRTNWGTALAPVSGACGSSNYYPKVSLENFYGGGHYLSTTELNSRQYNVDYVAKVKDDDGTFHCVSARDGLTVMKKRQVSCPSGYWASAIRPQTSPYNTQIGTKCNNNVTGKIIETFAYRAYA